MPFFEYKIGDTPVRFGYQSVKPDSFGLDILDILEADEKELNAYLPLRALAPYRSKDPVPKGRWDPKKKKAKLGYLGKKREDNPEKEAEQPQRKKKK